MTRSVRFSPDDLQVHGQEVHAGSDDQLSRQIAAALRNNSGSALRMVPDDEVLCVLDRADSGVVRLLEDRQDIDLVARDLTPMEQENADEAAPSRRKAPPKIWRIPLRLTTALDFDALGGGVPELHASLQGLALRLGAEDLYAFCTLIAPDPRGCWHDFQALRNRHSGRPGGYSFLAFARERLAQQRAA